MVSLKERTDRLVSVAGLKNAWRISQDDTLNVDNGLFVLFRTNNQSLATLIFESNDNVSHSLSSRKNKSLRCSAGLLELMELSLSSLHGCMIGFCQAHPVGHHIMVHCVREDLCGLFICNPCLAKLCLN